MKKATGVLLLLTAAAAFIFATFNLKHDLAWLSVMFVSIFVAMAGLGMQADKK